MNIGENIRKLRAAAGWTQEVLAERLNQLGFEVSSKTVSSWEVNRTEPNMGAIQKLTEVFKCKTTDIIGEEVTHEPYYLNEETRRIAQDAFERADLRMLMSAARDLTPENAEFVIEMAKKLRNKDLRAIK